jgi:hypothetical protein
MVGRSVKRGLTVRLLDCCNLTDKTTTWVRILIPHKHKLAKGTPVEHEQELAFTHLMVV